MDALVAAADEELRKHDGPLGVHGRIGDPVLLRQRRRRVDYELICCLVVLRCCLHLHCIVACSSKYVTSQRASLTRAGRIVCKYCSPDICFIIRCTFTDAESRLTLRADLRARIWSMTNMNLAESAFLQWTPKTALSPSWQL